MQMSTELIRASIVQIKFETKRIEDIWDFEVPEAIIAETPNEMQAIEAKPAAIGAMNTIFSSLEREPEDINHKSFAFANDSMP